MERKCGCGKVYDAKDPKRLNLCSECDKEIQRQSEVLNRFVANAIRKKEG